MACLTQDNRLIWTCSVTKKPRKILLTGMLRRDCKVFLTKVEELIAAADVGRQPDPATLDWARSLAPRYLDRLVAHRLIPESAGVRTDLMGFIDNFIKVRGAQVGTSANNHYRQAKDRILEYLPQNPDIRKITINDAIEFRTWLLDECDLASNSASKRCATLRAMFQYAVDADLIVKNPFADRRVRKAITPAADDRRHFLPHEDAVKIYQSCGEDKQLAAIFALCRWGGLRVGETLLLKWELVDLKEGKLKILSPKTAGVGKSERTMPLFPEMRRAILALPEDRRKPGDLLVPDYADKTTQWAGKALEAVLEKCGVPEWPRTWQSLRGTRATELADIYPAYLCNEWLGHTEAVANANYRRGTRAHYQSATLLETGGAQFEAARLRFQQLDQLGQAA